MKRVLILALLVFAATTSGYSQKADKAAAAQAQFDKAKAAIDAKSFVIIPDSYEASNGAFETNLIVEMQVSGSQIQAKVEILMRKGGNYAEVIITPSKGSVRRFSGEVTPKSESKYYKRPNVV